MISIPDISPAMFDALLAKLRQSAEVTEVSATTGPTYTVKGDFDGHHVEATFMHWDDLVLTIVVTKKPFLASEGMIAVQIRAAIADLE
jgi:hypothetical protein